MKLFAMDRIARRALLVRIVLTVSSLVLSNGIGFAQQEKKSKSTATLKPRTSQSPTPRSNPSPTPETKIDPRTEAELLQAEERFVIAILNRDGNALSELLTDYYADSFGEAERAVNKRGAIARATAGKLPAYRVAKERKLIRSGDTFTVEGLAKDSRPVISEENRNEEWVHVRRLWLRQGDRWLAIAQIIMPAAESESEKQPKEKERTNPVARRSPSGLRR